MEDLIILLVSLLLLQFVLDTGFEPFCSNAENNWVGFKIDFGIVCIFFVEQTSAIDVF